ncbi:MAG TPA: KH domain-containing protein [Elainellaceae cyanobacterium]
MSDSHIHSSPSSSAGSQSSEPDYTQLVRFLVQPFLESPQSLKVDSEVSGRTGRVLIRLAIEGEDKGRVFGRGGRNIQAIRTVIQAISKAAGHVAHLEIYGGAPTEHTSHDRPRSSKPPSRRPSRPRPQNH